MNNSGMLHQLKQIAPHLSFAFDFSKNADYTWPPRDQDLRNQGFLPFAVTCRASARVGNIFAGESAEGTAVDTAVYMMPDWEQRPDSIIPLRLFNLLLASLRDLAFRTDNEQIHQDIDSAIAFVETERRRDATEFMDKSNSKKWQKWSRDNRGSDR